MNVMTNLLMNDRCLLNWGQPPFIQEPVNQRPALPRSIWALGIVSLLMNSSSEMIHALLPLFLTGALGASTIAVGWIEGSAEAVTQIVKIFSGTISDAVGR